MLFQFLRQLHRISYSIPVALFILLGIVFGIMVPSLGFYWDDWETVLVGRLFSTSEFWTYFSSNRPLAAWTYIVFAPILNYEPLNWQLFTLALRWLSAWGLYRLLLEVWHDRKREAAGVAMLFAVYPVFTQQAIAMSYHHHWLQYLLFFTTIELMLYSVRYTLTANTSKLSIVSKPGFIEKNPKLKAILTPQAKKWWIFSGITGVNLILMVFNHGISEYFVTLELIRPVLIYFVLLKIFDHQVGRSSSANFSRRHFVGKAILYAMPYLTFIFIFATWRILTGFSTPDSPNQMVLINSLLISPFAALLQLAEMMLKDLVMIMASSWYPLLSVDALDLQNRINLFSWGIGILCAAGCALFLSRLPISGSVSNTNNLKTNWLLQAAVLGGLILVIGPMPVWITGKQASIGMFSNRFALTAIMGASLLWVAGISWLSGEWRKIALVVGLLILLSSAFHVRTLNTFRHSWIRQQRFHWQLFWRAPSIQPNTILVGDGDILTYNRPIPSINLLYAKPDESRQMAYWYFTADEVYRALAEKYTFSTNLRQFPFKGDPQNALLVYYGAANCLWVLNPGDAEHPELPQNLRELVGLIKLDRILATPHNLSYPPTDVFGLAPEHGWCYIYQKAELARQFFDWNTIRELGALAAKADYFKGASPYEGLPFIEGYARLGLWNQTRDLTRLMTDKDSRYRSMYCGVFQKILAGSQVGSDQQEQVHQILNEFNCQLSTTR